jgi:hypothetical protein
MHNGITSQNSSVASSFQSYIVRLTGGLCGALNAAQMCSVLRMTQATLHLALSSIGTTSPGYDASQKRTYHDADHPLASVHRLASLERPRQIHVPLMDQGPYDLSRQKSRSLRHDTHGA